MFIRIDRDLFVNINNISSFKLYDEGEAYKLIVWGNSGSILHTIFYIKASNDQMRLLSEIVNNFKELTVNPDIAFFLDAPADTATRPAPGVEEAPADEPERRIIESVGDVESEERSVQLSLFDNENQE